MRMLRTTAFIEGPTKPPLTMFAAEADLNVPLEEAYAEFSNGSFHPDVFQICKIEEVDTDDFVVAAAEITERLIGDAEREANMAMLFYYDANSLGVCTPDGMVTATERAPLTVEEITYVFEALAHHPNYKEQTVATYAEDGTPVKMHKGKVEVDA